MEIHTDYLILGGGIAGTTAAETIRQKDSERKISILSREPYTLYSRVLLPAYIQGKIKREQVFLRSIADYEKRNIDIFLSETSTFLDVEKKEVHTSRGNIFYFKKLLIATGGEPSSWKVSGTDDVPVARLQTIDDADAVKVLVEKASVREAVLVGGGFIGLEFINSFVPKNFRVHCVLREARYWAGYLDEQGSRVIEEHLEEQGVIFYRQQEVLLLGKDSEGIMKVRTSGGSDIQGAFIAAGIGISRSLHDFEGQGIEVGRGLKTNEFLETGAADMWAAGDIAEFYDTILEKYRVVGNWSNSFMQGRVAGLNMAASFDRHGSKTGFKQVSSYSLNALGMHITFLGDVEAGGSEGFSRTDERTYYERFFVRNNRLVGAIMINKFEDRTILERLIQERREIAPFLDSFQNSALDLKTLTV